MKNIFLFLSAILCTGVIAQPYNSYNIQLISKIAPDTANPKSGNRYSGCWGWYQANKNREYVLSGGRSGTWFIDVTNPSNPTVCDYVPGASKNCTWRELKTYQNYCYIVSDVCSPNAFQIVDMKYLPDSVHVVHSDTTLFRLGHTIWIDKDKMYVASTNFGPQGGYSPMTVWSLATPTAPVLLRRMEKDNSVAEVHDMYVRNDTVYASVGWQGLKMYKLVGDSLEQFASYNGYSAGSYNHSSFLAKNGKYLVFCDEVPEAQPFRVVDVQNFENIQPLQTVNPHPKTTPHNPYVLGNDWAVISSYQDGVFIYDLRNLPSIGLAGSFDTHPQGGFNVDNYGGNAYAGNWGAYPFLPSGIIVAQDMQNGIFLLDASAAYVNPVGVTKNHNEDLKIYPNPATDRLNLILKKQGIYNVTMTNLLGELVALYKVEGSSAEINTHSMQPGAYFLTVEGEGTSLIEKVIISK